MTLIKDCIYGIEGQESAAGGGGVALARGGGPPTGGKAHIKMRFKVSNDKMELYDQR